MTVDEVLDALRGLEDARMRAVNVRWGDRHGANLTGMRALARRLKTDHPLALALWDTGDPDARLLATLICRPKLFGLDALDALARQIDFPKLTEWFLGNVLKKSDHAEALRQRWKDLPGLLGRLGWGLTTDRVVKTPEGLDLTALLDQIEVEMKDTPAQKQWAMNHCLAEIGIRHPEHRARAIAIGERLEVLKDYPASPGCTPPFAPIWIAEMVRRQTASAPG